ncbi:MAG TPA: hypothetical protein VG897_17685 [Terriglobales bacterium]|nr:hypothetical protein [Terriglobales bacterium]
MRTPFRIAWAISLLICLVALLVVPGMTTLIVRSHTSGKQVVRLLGAQMVLTLALALAYRWILRPPSARWSSLPQGIHGLGWDLLEQTCVLRC